MNQRLALSLGAVMVWLVITVAGGRFHTGNGPLTNAVTRGLGWPFLAAAVFLLAVITWQSWRDVGLNAPASARSLLLTWLPMVYIFVGLGLTITFGPPPTPVLLWILLNSLLVGLSEELMFRGVLVRPLADAARRRDPRPSGGLMPVTSTVWTMLALGLVASAVSASESASLIDLPVTGTAQVPTSQYIDATSHAARGASPLDITLGVVGLFEGNRQVIVQTNERAESPAASRVTVIRDGLLDDAVRTERWDVALGRTAAGTWEIREVTRSWRCRRGSNTAGFWAQPCP